MDFFAIDAVIPYRVSQDPEKQRRQKHSSFDLMEMHYELAW